MTAARGDHPRPAPRVADGEASAVPAKCVACDRELQDAVVCDSCHSLNPVNGTTDYFALLGVPRRFHLDPERLRGRYLALNRHAHPDFHAQDDPAVRELALSVSSAVNDAYRTLRDPISRAEYLLTLLGGAPSAEDKSIPHGFLAEMVELQEQLHDAKAQNDRQTMQRMAAALTGRLDQGLARLEELFAGFEDRVGCEAIRRSELDRIRKQLNAISYIRRLLNVANSE